MGVQEAICPLIVEKGIETAYKLLGVEKLFALLMIR
jgi:hypothetical protein